MPEYGISFIITMEKRIKDTSELWPENSFKAWVDSLSQRTQRNVTYNQG